MSGTTQTARDIGASVLLSPGTGTGQINLSSGSVPVTGDLTTTMKASVNTECDTALVDAGLTTTVTGRIDAAISTRQATLTSTELNQIADALLKRDWASVSAEASYSVLNALRVLRNAWSTSGGTLTVKGEDGTTTKWTRTLATDAAAQPIVSST